MAGGTRQIFEDASDEDSIDLNSTEPSDSEDQYGVETILDEQWSVQAQEIQFLVKWEGYPLHKATWEPAENFETNDMIDEWKKRQALILQGREKPFDRMSFYELEERERYAKEERQRRRAAKRRRLGIRAKSARGDDDRSATVFVDAGSKSSSEDEPLARSKRQKMSPVRRKGVAQVRRKSPFKSSGTTPMGDVVVSDESGEAKSSSMDSDSGDSMMDELQAKSTKQRTKAQPKMGADRADRATATGSMRTSNDLPSKKRTLSERRASEPRIASTVTTTPSSVRPTVRKSATMAAPTTRQVPAASAARASGDTSKPAAGVTTSIKPAQTAKRTSKTAANNVFTADWDKQKKRKYMRATVSGETPKDSTDPKFKRLSIQNRFQKFSVNEPPPDVSKLAVFNPTTGRLEQPAGGTGTSPIVRRPPTPPRRDSIQQNPRATRTEAPARLPTAQPTSGASMSYAQPLRAARRSSGGESPLARGPSELRSVYGRRRTPPPGRARTPSPPADTGNPDGPRTYLHDRSGNVNPEKAKQVICTNWMAGRCNFGPDCWFAHTMELPPPEKRPNRKEVTCTYWIKRGFCKKPESMCEFAHRDTGLYRLEDGRIVAENPYRPKMNSANVGASELNAQILPERVRSPYSDRPLSDASIAGNRTVYSTVASPNEITPDAGAQNYSHAAPLVPKGPKRKNVTCEFWLKGQCKYGSECRFAHRNSIQDERGTGLDRIRTDFDAQPTGANTALLPVRTYSEHQRPTQHDQLSPSIVTPANKLSASAGHDLSPVQSPARVDVVPHAHPARLTIETDVTPTEVQVRLMTTLASDQRLMSEFISSGSHFTMSRMVNAADIQHYCGDQLGRGMQWPVGDVTAQGDDKIALVKLAELCKLTVTCGVVLTADFTMLVYPSGVDEWKFLTRSGDTSAASHVLRFKLLPAMPAAAMAKPGASLGSTQAVVKGDGTSLVTDQLLGLDVERLMHLGINDQNVIKRESHAFIMMPSSHQAEMDLLQRMLGARGCKAVTSSTPGAWDDFRKRHRGDFLLIVHPDVPLYDIPSLGIFLNDQVLRVFSVGWQPAVEDQPPRYECERVFPQGYAVFITDSVLKYHPEKATKIITGIAALNKKRGSGAARIQVVMRPGVKDWLMQLAVERMDSAHTAADHSKRLYETVYQLCPLEPNEKADIVSVAPHEFPTFAELEQSNPDAASDYIVNWYAGWAISNKSSIRRFSVCNETESTGTMLNETFQMVEKPGQQDPRGWSKQYQHLLVVLPTWWLKWLEKRR